ncbi:MAG: hypothetical protein QM784_25420 [Polyangiaceae bacterium]
MITDPATIQKLALRSDLPRLKSEGFFLFAQLEPAEQVLLAPTKSNLLARALVTIVAREEQHADRPLPAIQPRAYLYRELSPDWAELQFAYDLAAPYERRNRKGNVLAIAKHLKLRVRLFNGAFAYFAPDDLTPLETLDAEGFSAIPEELIAT